MRHMRLLVIVGGSAALLCGAAAPGRASMDAVEVPLALERNYVIVPVTVGSHGPLYFVLDTAAGGSVISPDTLRLLGLQDQVQPTTVVGGSGTEQLEKVPLPTLSVGGLHRDELSAFIIDLQRFESPESGRGFAGILGLDFLRHFDFVIDGKRNVLRLEPRGAGAPTVIADDMRCVENLATNSDDGWLNVPVEVNGATVRAVLDSAAGRSIYNWPAARAAGVDETTRGVRRSVRNTAGLGTSTATETWNYGFPDVVLGGLPLTPSDARIADLPIFEVLGFKDSPAMLFGFNYLRDRVLAVSYSTNQVCVS